MRSITVALALCGVSALAQSGDRPGEVQPPPPASMKIPEAPPLSPEDALKAFRLQPGYKIEMVASEPLIEAPVAMAFHPNGDLYVVEMRNYMPDVDGLGETNHIGRVSVLRDTDVDGRMDQATVFLDNLNMPRAVALAYDGVLVAEPPNLWFCRDTNGDRVSDEKISIASDYGDASNPEHNANGLVWGMDNWFYNAKHPWRYRRANGVWEREPSAVISGRGQWGIAQDDFGRLVFNSNSDYLRGDFVPAELLYRNPNNRSPFGANEQFDRNQEIWPARVNPGVNRGYEKGELREDGTLAAFTAACGPVIYRGDQFDSTLRGAAFVCEPAGNLVRASILSERNGVIAATNAFPKSEFLASTDERFRPVNLHNGPDGALYVVDMYRGHLQHRMYTTTYLRKQILQRGLDHPDNLGRIYRITQEGRVRRQIEPLATNSPQLVATLQHPNGWHRDTAQRLLVERAEAAAAPALKTISTTSAKDASAIHALWTLRGIGQLEAATVKAALQSQNPRTRATAARLAGDFALNNSEMRDALVKLSDDPNALVRLHALFSLGPIAGNSNVAEAMSSILRRHGNEPLFRDVALSGLGGQEYAFLDAIVKNADWRETSAGSNEVIAALAWAIAVSRDGKAITKLFDIAAAEKGWRREAILKGFVSSAPPARKDGTAPVITPIQLAAEPPGIVLLRKELSAEEIKAIERLLAWPAKAGGNQAAAPAAPPLTEAENERFEAGKQLYTLTCGTCHMPHGLGQEGLAPPLAQSEWVTGSPDRLARIVLHGLRGPITVLGKEYSLEMPPLGILDDEQIAAVATYVRREWGHTASPVTPEWIAKVREATAGKEEPWSEADLLKVP